MSDDITPTLHDELDEHAKTCRRANMLAVAAGIFTAVYGLTAVLNFNSDGGDFWGEGVSAEDLRFAAIYAATMAGVCAVILFMALFKSRFAAVVLWIPIALWWADWVIFLVSGDFPGVPWLPGLATYMAFRGSGAVFRYQKLMKEERAAQNASTADVFE